MQGHALYLVTGLTTARALKDCGGERGLATMCVGVGQGSALALARV